MKTKRKIRWSESVGTKQFHTSFFGTERSLPGELSLFVLCTLLFFGAAFGMIRMVFEWEVFTVGMLFRVFLVTLLVSALVEVTGLLKSKRGRLLRLVIGPLGILGFAFYLFRTVQGERVISGLQAIATSYLSRWNAYHGTALRCSTGDFDARIVALEFVITFLCFVLVWWGRVRKKPLTTALVPLLVLVAELLIGWAPGGLSIFVAGAGVFLANAAGYRRPEFTEAPDKFESDHRKHRMHQFFWVPVGVFLLVLCIVVRTAGSASATETVSGGKQKVKQKNKEIIEKITEWTGWQEVNVAKSVERAVRKFLDKNEIETENRPEANYAKLDNRKPEYKEETVLKVALDKKSSSGAYLIGFYADTYEDGVWDTDADAFEKACEKAGFDPQEVGRSLLTLSVRRAAKYYGTDSLAELSYRGIHGWMYYAKANLTKAYIPYFAEVTEDGILVEGDSRYIKEKKVTKLPFVLWNYDIDDLVGVLFDGEKKEQAWEKEPWEQWYESYVAEEYLTVPAGMEQVQKVAGEIQSSGRSFFRIEGEESVNFDRLNKAYQVADWMRGNTSYSLDLPDLPKGSDPVEYFLGTSRQGYCMHYASASVMLLREMGVPARYVSGYVAGSFQQDGLTKKYEAVVPDSAAHAWVEIYLDGFGWVPVEVTNGYSVLPSGTQIFQQTESGGYKLVRENWPDDAYPWEDRSYWYSTKPFVTPEPTPTPVPTPTSAPTATQAPEEAENTQTSEDAENSKPQPGDTENRETAGDAEAAETKQYPQEKKTKADFSMNPVILLFVLLGIGLVLPLLKGCKKISCAVEERRVYRKTKYRGNRQRIKLWNRMLYRKLRAKGKFRKKYVWDEEYEAVLKKYDTVLTAEERERYMYLVKEATFSFHEFTKEEAEFCKRVYHRIVYEEKKNSK